MATTTSAQVQYNLVSKNLPKAEATFVKGSPAYQRAVAHFQAALPNIKSVDDLLKDRTTLQVALGAFGLDGIVDQKGLLKKILTQDPNDKNSYVNRLIDPRYKQFVAAFGSLSTDGGKQINTKGFADTILSAYEVDQFETAEGNKSPAIREALYFARTASKVTTTLQVLGDKTLADVVRTAQGLPAEFSTLDPNRQVAMLKRAGFDPAKLSDPTFLAKYVQRYLVAYDTANPPNGDVTGGLAALFQSSGDPTDPTSFITPVNLGVLAPQNTTTGTSATNDFNSALLSLFG
jgi:hypothetical protein